LTEFVLQLSDQQLIVGLLLLVCAYVKYWPSSVVYGADNLWIATDIACFSNYTHAATLLSLRPYFRRHHRLATARVIVMYIIYILWMIPAGYILSPKKPHHSEKKTTVVARFWHATTVIEAIGMMWIYLITYLPIFLSEEAYTVRNVISEGSREDFEPVRAWIRRHEDRQSLGRVPRTTWKKYNPYAVSRRHLTRFALCFGKRYINEKSRWRRAILWALSELFFPFYVTGILLVLLWAYSLGALAFALRQSGLARYSWDFGQLLPVLMVLLPFQGLVTTISGKSGLFLDELC
jgi:hypothetical protein